MATSSDVPELLFDRYFTQHPSPVARKRYPGRATTLGLGDQLFEQSVEAARDEINRIFEINTSKIVTPHGQAKLHVDFLESTEINAFAFSYCGWSFIAITTALLSRFTKISLSLWRLNLLEEVLGLCLDAETRNPLAAAFMIVQLQFLSNHELGHFFHGHCESDSATFVLAEFGAADRLSYRNSGGDPVRLQAMEVEADGYAAHMMAENLFNGGIGAELHRKLRSTLSVDDFTLNFFLCAGSAHQLPVHGDPSRPHHHLSLQGSRRDQSAAQHPRPAQTDGDGEGNRHREQVTRFQSPCRLVVTNHRGSARCKLFVVRVQL